MSRRVPDCAACGKSLKTVVPNVRMRFDGLPGSPEVGWHTGTEYPWDCYEKDPLAIMPKRGRYAQDTLIAIQTRNKSALTANLAWTAWLASKTSTPTP